MSTKVETKKFGKSERSVPHHSEKAQKWYPAEDDAQARKVRLTVCVNFPVVRLPMDEISGIGRLAWGVWGIKWRG